MTDWLEVGYDPGWGYPTVWDAQLEEIRDLPELEEE